MVYTYYKQIYKAVRDKIMIPRRTTRVYKCNKCGLHILRRSWSLDSVICTNCGSEALFAPVKPDSTE